MRKVSITTTRGLARRSFLGFAILVSQSLATLMTATTTSGSNSASPPWPTRLGGIILEVRDSMGASRLAPLIFVSPTQISFQVLADTALGEATLAIVSDGGTSQAGSMQVEAVAPGLFMASHASGIPAATAVRTEPDGAQVPIPVFSWSTEQAQARGRRPVQASSLSYSWRSLVNAIAAGPTPSRLRGFNSSGR